MDNILLWVLGGGGAATLLIGIVNIFVTVWSRRRNERQAHEDTLSRRAAARQEVCASLLTSTRQLRNELHDLRSLHDSLVRRFLNTPIALFTLQRRLRNIVNAISACRSRLILDPDAKSVDEAIGEFLQAWDSYSLAIYLPVKKSMLKKTDSQELARLERAMNIKLVALEAAAAQFANKTPAAAPSRVRRLINAPVSLWRRGKRPTAGTSLPTAQQHPTSK